MMFMSSIVLGIAALVAINSFNYNLLADVDRQAATLLGADLMVSGNREATPELLTLLDSLPGERSSEMELFSMAFLPEQDASQFVRIKALKGRFPFYGILKTEPESAAQTYQQEGKLLVDDGMMLQYNLEVGDSVRLGQKSFLIGGRLQSAFGSINAGSSFAPTIYMEQQYIHETDLLGVGSVVDYAYYHKVPEDFEIDRWRKEKRKIFDAQSMRLETIEGRKENLNEAFNSLNYFLNLVALVSLLLGCIGVASSVFIYVKTKLASIAVFRCLGMKGNDAFLIYFFQISALGFLSVLAGTVLGSFIQILLPKVLGSFLPFQVTTALSWTAILEGIVIGSVITMLFALLPLIAVRKISPLRTLRASFDEDVKPKDPLRAIVILAIAISVLLFLWQLTGNVMDTLVFGLGLLVSFLLLYFVSLFIVWAVRRFFPRKLNFIFRQGLSNLYRPNNQTQTLLVSIGLGTSVLTTLFIIQGLLLNNVAQMDAGNQPNMILFGIENGQEDGVAKITQQYEMPLTEQVPIVTMKLEEWKGRTKAEWQADTTANIGRWAMNRETRVTYRDTLDKSEKLVDGKLHGAYTPDSDSIFISLGDSYAEELGIELGDEMVWNVQGARINTYVSSFRKIDFRSMRTRFFIVFPTGVLEEAPQFQVLVTKSPDTETTARYRNDVVKAFPNVSVIDLGMILTTLNDIVSKVSYIIQFMAGFSILTGLIVLISSLLLSKYQRIKEAVLLRTIGASRKQILGINATEYALLGILSAATGIIISLAGSYLIAKYQLNLPFDIQWWPILSVFFFVVGMTVLIGMLNTREVIQKSPLEVLRDA